MIEYVTADLFTTRCQCIIHGCNTKGVMGAGVAKSIKARYPEVFKVYHEFCSKNGSRALGKILPVKTDNDDRIIINAFTQVDTIGNGRRVSYDAIDTSMEAVATYVSKFPVRAVAMPKIGAGLGGGHWPIIEKIIEHRLKDFSVKVYDLPPSLTAQQPIDAGAIALAKSRAHSVNMYSSLHIVKVEYQDDRPEAFSLSCRHYPGVEVEWDTIIYPFNRATAEAIVKLGYATPWLDALSP